MYWGAGASDSKAVFSRSAPRRRIVWRVALLTSLLPAAMSLLTASGRTALLSPYMDVVQWWLRSADAAVLQRVQSELEANYVECVSPGQVESSWAKCLSTSRPAGTAIAGGCGEYVTDAGVEPAATFVNGPIHVLNAAGKPRVTHFGAEQMAGVIKDVATIGEACDVLLDAGRSTDSSGNRITADDEMCVQYLGLALGTTGQHDPSWVRYQIACTHNGG
jgi:hypothetical protein